MQVSDSAKEKIVELMQKKNVNTLRIYFSGYGWGGPQIGMALEEPEANDKVETINGIQIAIDSVIYDQVADATLDYRNSFLGGGFVFDGGQTSSC